MSARESVRPGGRSARVQASVHKAVQDLLLEMERSELTIPLIAARAGVTPSTIYRRWGGLPDLLGDVAVERLRPDQAPTDTGTFRGDLGHWLEQYADEMSSGPGRAMIRDVLACETDAKKAGQCCNYTYDQLMVLADRAVQRGERVPDVDTIIDHAVAPVMFRILFDAKPITPIYCRSLIDRLLSREG